MLFFPRSHRPHGIVQLYVVRLVSLLARMPLISTTIYRSVNIVFFSVSSLGYFTRSVHFHRNRCLFILLSFQYFYSAVSCYSSLIRLLQVVDFLCHIATTHRFQLEFILIVELFKMCACLWYVYSASRPRLLSGFLSTLSLLLLYYFSNSMENEEQKHSHGKTHSTHSCDILIVHKHAYNKMLVK